MIHSTLDQLGPLPKSFSTYQLEELFRRLISNERFHVEKPMALVFGKDGAIYLMNELLSNANLEHLIFHPLDFERYNQYAADNTHPLFQSTLTEEQERHCRDIFPDLSLAEMRSINIYTGGAYNDMNIFLRRKPEFFHQPLDVMKAIMIHSIMCCSALTKTPDRSIQETFRVEKIPTDNTRTLYLQKRINAAKEQTIIYLEGFVSTSVGAPTQSGDIVYLFKNLKGKYIKPLSQCPAENEYLIPPTQIRVERYDGDRTNVKLRRFKHSFEVSTTSVLGHRPIKSLIQPTLNEFIKLSIYKWGYISDNTKDEKLKRCIQEALKILLSLSMRRDNILHQKEDLIYKALLTFHHSIDAYLNGEAAHLPRPVSIKSLFFMPTLSSSYIKPLAITLCIIGLAGVLVGSFGLACMIALGLATSLLITIGGGVFLSVGGFFAIKQQEHDASLDQQRRGSNVRGCPESPCLRLA